MTRKRSLIALAGLSLIAPALVIASRRVNQPPALEVSVPRHVSGSEQYAYQTAPFSLMIEDSFRDTSRKPETFYTWLANAYARAPRAHLGPHKTLIGAIQAQRTALRAARTPVDRARMERETGTWLHRMVKAVIPRFSLERGFEFSSAVTYGERQCLLQSVLISGLAQSVGINAGVVMVWRNQKSQVSNLGHVTAVFRLPTGKDLLIDASDPEPFMRHTGVFTLDRSARDLRFLEPVFDAQSEITAYKRTLDGGLIQPGQVGFLDVNYIRSQFHYYRGERAPGGFYGPSTPSGLARSAAQLETAVRFAPDNPLAVYVLGLVYRKQGKQEAARERISQAFALYTRFGFVPDGPRNAYNAP